jgi:hypothetical protein
VAAAEVGLAHLLLLLALVVQVAVVREVLALLQQVRLELMV